MCHQGYHKGLESENSATNFLEGLFTMRGKLPGSKKSIPCMVIGSDDYLLAFGAICKKKIICDDFSGRKTKSC